MMNVKTCSSGLLLALLANLPFGHASADSRNICVRNFTKISLTNVEADSILHRASAVLDDAGHANPPCSGIVLSKQGNVTPYDENDFPRSLSTKDDFQKFTSDPCVKVVERIIWCDHPFQVGEVLGCAPMPGQGLVVVRELPGLPSSFNQAAVEPITWLHEYGHTLGLQHNSTKSHLMAPGIDANSRLIDTQECMRFAANGALAANTPSVPGANTLTPAPSGKASAAGVPMPGGAGVRFAQAAPVSPPLPVEEFVKQVFGPQFPIDIAEQYKPDLKKVQGMLFDPKFAPYQRNIVALLGVIGNKETLPIVSGLIQSPISAENADADISARFAAPLALGAIARRVEAPEKDVNILKRADTEFWEERLAPAAAPNSGKQRDKDDIEALARDLATQSYRGYAISGSEEAGKNIKADQENAKNAALPKPILDRRLSTINEAIMLNEKSRESGPFAVFK